MTGGAGIVAASSAQSRRVAAGVEHSGTELEAGEVRDGGCEMVTAGGSGTVAAAKGTVYDEVAHLGDDWGEPGRVGSEGGMRGKRGASVDIGSIVSNTVGV